MYALAPLTCSCTLPSTLNIVTLHTCIMPQPAHTQPNDFPCSHCTPCKLTGWLSKTHFHFLADVLYISAMCCSFDKCTQGGFDVSPSVLQHYSSQHAADLDKKCQSHMHNKSVAKLSHAHVYGSSTESYHNDV